MELHQFGNTKIKTARLCLGTASLGRPGYITLGHNLDIEDDSKEGMEHHMHNMLDLAYEKGIRYFDTARSYGLAELFLGNWLEEQLQERLQEITIGTKWGYTYTANWASG